MSNPFLSPKAHPGDGTIHLALLPPSTPRLRTLNYQYPLKLVSPAPSRAGDDLVHTVYLLTYGGGLVAGDTIDLKVDVERKTKLVLLTQGSTKLFKSLDRDLVSKQCMTVNLDPGAALCYLPDPVQPFEQSCFEQQQIYNVTIPTAEETQTGSLCVLDWVSNGRPANGENWSFFHYRSKNEVFLRQSDGKQRLLLRDSVLLDDREDDGSIAARMDDLAVFGTLIIYGPFFRRLGQFFMDEFKALPRIGGRKWDSGSDSGEEEAGPHILRRLERQRREAEDRVLWSAADVRGCVVVKLGAREVEGGRKWLRDMLTEEGSVREQFGERALLCLR
ncbi:uncharacterized protein LTR77_007372 [Saxophila tyrrhenica]|uniref:Urease accessory protein UreD n=1 Tax=Saxophila tyrrhenica TaxID=1690608 RepID=A0AAV9P579_9PEZI|nr:hypothetical protein LTR77_007372 [Saxophila tyrrhenica]